MAQGQGQGQRLEFPGQGQGLKGICKLDNSWYFICHKNKNNVRAMKH